jgi:hypothetical protein
MQILEISKGVYNNDSTGNGIIIGHSLYQVLTQYVPCAQAQPGQQTPVKHEIYAQNLGNTEYPLPVGHVFQYILTQRLSKNHHPFLTCPPWPSPIFCRCLFYVTVSHSCPIWLSFRQGRRVTRGTKVSSFTTKRQQIFMTAILAFDPGKSTVQIPTLQPALARLTPFLTQDVGLLLRKRFPAIDTRDQVWARDIDELPPSHRDARTRRTSYSDLPRPFPALQNLFLTGSGMSFYATVIIACLRVSWTIHVQFAFCDVQSTRT